MDSSHILTRTHMHPIFIHTYVYEIKPKNIVHINLYNNISCNNHNNNNNNSNNKYIL